MKSMIIYNLFLFSLLTMIILVSKTYSYAQPVLPPRSITITATQPIHFGTFGLTSTTGGTITLGYDGTRQATGGVLLLSMEPTSQQAIFDIKLCQGRNVTITYAHSVFLTGSNGGAIEFEIGPTDKGESSAKFPVIGDCNFITTLSVGGILHLLPGEYPAGTYTGSFEITFEQE